MAMNKPLRRLPLRDLLTEVDKRSRDLAEHLNVTWLALAEELRELSRPIRKRSHYPTLLALLNCLNQLLETSVETEEKIAHLDQRLEEIREHARRERLNR
jgi:hypothetical protein